jgi:hypothetical protein
MTNILIKIVIYQEHTEINLFMHLVKQYQNRQTKTNRIDRSNR